MMLVFWLLASGLSCLLLFHLFDMLQAASVQLVGSVPFNSAKEVSIKSLQALPGGLHSDFNGERGSR